jgi:predicted AlkP superfamily phosphohydrolase/phosphomutase
VQLGRARREVWQRRIFLSLNDIDWSRSTAYSIGNFGQIFVNLAGREPQGTVSPGDKYTRLLDELTRKLELLKDPETGETVITKIQRGDEIYHGPYAHRAPDLLFFTRNMEYKAMGLSDFSSSNVFDPVFGTTGHHRMNGVLICHGPGVFRENTTCLQANIADLAPTILYMLDHNIPKEMDGKVLLDVFTASFNSARTLKYTEKNHSGKENKKHNLTSEEEAELAARLRGLGYVN